MTEPTPGHRPDARQPVGRRARDAASSSCSCRASTNTSPAASTTRSTSGPASSSSIAPTTVPAPTSTGRGARRPNSSARPRRWSHQGLQAFDAGDVEQARRLLTSALEHGARARAGAAGAAPHRAARLAAAGRAGAAAGALATGAATGHRTGAASRGAGWPCCPAAAGDERGRRRGSWSRRLETSPAGSTPVIDPAAAVLPVPGASEAYLVARRCAVHRRASLPDALAVLDRIGTRRSARIRRPRPCGRGCSSELLRAAGLGMSAGGERSPP